MSSPRLRDEISSQLDPRPGERWLDLGCGAGEMTALLWRLSGGQLGEIITLDRAEAFAEVVSDLRQRLQPAPRDNHIRFVVGTPSDGLRRFADAAFDGIVSGLSLAYAEAQDPATGRFTDAAYNRQLAECRRVLKPGGRFVFAVQAPELGIEPLFGQTAQTSPPVQALFDALFQQRYARWLRREAKRGRFHFLSLAQLAARLRAAGFAEWTSQPFHDGTGHIVCARKQATVSRKAA